MTVVHVREKAPPEKARRVEWFLLTTLPVRTVEEAQQVLTRYGLRGRIEDWFRVLKSGCRVEDLAHHGALRLERAITINAVIAWRTHAHDRLGPGISRFACRNPVLRP